MVALESKKSLDVANGFLGFDCIRSLYRFVHDSYSMSKNRVMINFLSKYENKGHWNKKCLLMLVVVDYQYDFNLYMTIFKLLMCDAEL